MADREQSPAYARMFSPTRLPDFLAKFSIHPLAPLPSRKTASLPSPAPSLARDFLV
jgi:hypothetical protein